MDHYSGTTFGLIVGAVDDCMRRTCATVRDVRRKAAATVGLQENNFA